MKKIAVIIVAAALLAGCEKRDIKSDQIISWTNKSADTLLIAVEIDAKGRLFELMPHQSRTVGDESWIGRTYLVTNYKTTDDFFTVELKNTLYSEDKQ